jgi:hypothetical protein
MIKKKLFTVSILISCFKALDNSIMASINFFSSSVFYFFKFRVLS